MLNVLCMMGRLTQNPELRMTQSGNSVCLFSIACQRDFSKDGNKETDFFNCVCFGKTAEFVEKWFSKGEMIALTGRLQNDKYQTRDGEEKTATKINVNSVWFGESRNNNDFKFSDERPQADYTQATDIDVDDKDLPF